MSSCQPNLRRKSCQTIKIIFDSVWIQWVWLWEIIDRYIFPVFQDRNIPCTIVVLIRVLYKHTAVCRITKQNLLFLICAGLQLARSETKLTVNFRNRIIWFSSQIITTGSATVCFDYVMLLSIEVLYQLIMSIDKYIKTDICFFCCCRFFCIIRNNHIWTYCIIWLNSKAHGMLCFIFTPCNCWKSTIFLSAFPVYILRLFFYTRLCTNCSCKCWLSCNKINCRKITQSCLAVNLSIVILYCHTVKTVISIIVVF